VGFDAGTAVEAMDFDFTTIPGGKGKGVVPEPSTTDMKVFQKAFSKVMREGEKLNEASKDPAKLSEEEFELLQKQGEEIGEQLDAAIAKLCKNKPTAEQVATLPFRHKTAFSKWLMEQFNPEKGEAATTS
jgi:hypothetical protein